MEKKDIIVLTISTVVNAPIERVWNKFNSPDHITNWYFASPDWCAPSARSDFREGGTAMVRMESHDGSSGFDFEWFYDRIVTNERVEFHLSDTRRVEVIFEQTTEGVKITESFDAETQNTIELQQGGWQAILDNFKAYAETNDQ
jgi:uncharacterized protein YndB with AHSA1/START domain